MYVINKATNTNKKKQKKRLNLSPYKKNVQNIGSKEKKQKIKNTDA